MTTTNRWWVIAERDLLIALRQVMAEGEPDMVMAELLANSEVARVEPDSADNETDDDAEPGDAPDDN